MDRISKKKEIERNQLIKFISNENLNLLVKGIQNSETPDFILDIDNKKVSIEHTRLINPDLKKKEKYRDRIIKNAQKRFDNKYEDKLYLLMTFNNIELEFSRKQEQKYTDEIFTLIENIYLCNKKYSFSIDTKKSKRNYSELIKSFFLDNNKGFSHWQHFGAYLVDWIDMEWLKSIIVNKENKIVNYKTNFDENWLLLVSDFGTKSSANRTDLIDFSIIKTKFDKVYLYSYRADEIEIIK